MKSVEIRDETARKIALLAAQRQMKPEALVNKILDHYLTGKLQGQEQNGTDFLLSIAGMFDTGTNNTSERVRAVVADAVIQKHHGIMHEGIDR
ncbi:MAG: hypothetical protein JXM69_16025 [Anaerolineae bacterium]|nr:hypothetical protein [Anaerolineae bacterium]